jgi:IS1 family transposase
MNTLKLDKQIAVISALVEGNSIRSAERMTGVHRDTIMRLLARVGQEAQDLHNRYVRGLTPEFVQMDEIWCFVGKKQRNVLVDPELGDWYTYVALDSTSKVAIAYRVDRRTAAATQAFVDDVADRVTCRVQVSTDQYPGYKDAVEKAFGAEVDFARIQKVFHDTPQAGRYSPGSMVKASIEIRCGDPEPEFISTSHVERQNLSMRMMMRRFTRLTNGFSKRAQPLKSAVALHFAAYNFTRMHSTIRMTPAMAAGVADHPWDVAELLWQCQQARAQRAA